MTEREPLVHQRADDDGEIGDREDDDGERNGPAARCQPGYSAQLCREKFGQNTAAERAGENSYQGDSDLQGGKKAVGRFARSKAARTLALFFSASY